MLTFIHCGTSLQLLWEKRLLFVFITDLHFYFGLGSGKGLLIHNAFRKKHHAPPLIWNTEIAERANKMATEMATKGTLDVALVKSVTKYGENVARISGTHTVFAL